MQITQEQLKIILDKQDPSLDKAKIVDSLVAKGVVIEGYNDKPAKVEPTLRSKIDSNIQDIANKNVDTPISGGIKALGSTAGLLTGEALSAVGSVMPQGVKDAAGNVLNNYIEATGVKTNPLIQKGVSAVAGAYNQLPQEVRNVTEGVGELALNVLPVASSVKMGVNSLGKVASNVAEGLSKVPQLSTGVAEKAMNLISADPQAKVVSILQRSTPDDVARVVESARKASLSGEAPTPFEITGNKLADTVKLLQTKLSAIGQAKSDIILPLREGMGSFVTETQPFIGKLTSLKNSFSEIDSSSKKIVQSVINDAKKVTTKMQADKLIDKLQDALYTGNQSQTIVQGSALDKQLRGILGGYNKSLKASLPKEYANLNDQYSKLVDTLSVVNKSLGDVVEGVPIRGASLIKQYFSPSGSKAKEIFEFIKKETNGQVDLAKEATLSKFAMELFDDTRANSLLSGIGDIPTTVGGVITKAVEKVGGERLQNAMRNSTVSKAKKLAKPAKGI